MFKRFVCTDILAPNSPSMIKRMSSFLLVKRGYFSHGSFISCFQGKKRGSEYVSCTSCFLGVFNLKYSVCQSSKFCGERFWSPLPGKSRNINTNGQETSSKILRLPNEWGYEIKVRINFTYQAKIQNITVDKRILIYYICHIYSILLYTIYMPYIYTIL